MKKTLFFYIYCDTEIQNMYQIYKLHLESIKAYKHVFDNIVFLLGVDNGVSMDFIESWKIYISNYIEFNKELEFRIVVNDKIYRECIHFINEIFINLDSFDGLICWAHSKRDFDYNKDFIQSWILMIYHQLFSDTNKIEEVLSGDNNICTAGSLSTFLNFNKIFYTGAFFWWYPKKILKIYPNKFNDILNYINIGNEAMIKYNYDTDVFCFGEFCEQINMIFLPLYSIGQKKLIPYIYCTIKPGLMFYDNCPYYVNFIENNKDYFEEDFYNNYLTFKEDILNKI